MPDLGQLSFDVAFGGAVYALVDARSLHLDLTTRDFKRVVKNELVAIESILGTTMTVRLVEQTTVGGVEQVVPEVGGTSYVMSQGKFYFDPTGSLQKAASC